MGIRLFKCKLLLLLFIETFFGCGLPLLGSIEPLHLFFENFVDVGNVGTLVLKLSSESRELIA